MQEETEYKIAQRRALNTEDCNIAQKGSAMLRVNAELPPGINTILSHESALKSHVNAILEPTWEQGVGIESVLTWYSYPSGMDHTFTAI